MNTILFYSGAFRGYYRRLIRARRSKTVSILSSLSLIVRANGRVR